MGFRKIFSACFPKLRRADIGREQETPRVSSDANAYKTLEGIDIGLIYRQPKQAEAQLHVYLIVGDAAKSVSPSEAFSVAFASWSLLNHLSCRSRQEYVLRLEEWLAGDPELADQVIKLSRCAASHSPGMLVYPLEKGLQLRDGMYNLVLTMQTCLLTDMLAGCDVGYGGCGSFSSRLVGGAGVPALAVSHQLKRVADQSAVRQQEIALTNIPTVVTALLMDGRVVYQNPRSQQYMGSLVGGYTPPPGASLAALMCSSHPLRWLFRFDEEALQAFEVAMAAETEFRRVVKVPKRFKRASPTGPSPVAGMAAALAQARGSRGAARRERPGTSRMMRQTGAADRSAARSCIAPDGMELGLLFSSRVDSREASMVQAVSVSSIPLGVQADASRRSGLGLVSRMESATAEVRAAGVSGTGAAAALGDSLVPHGGSVGKRRLQVRRCTSVAVLAYKPVAAAAEPALAGASSVERPGNRNMVSKFGGCNSNYGAKSGGDNTGDQLSVSNSHVPNPGGRASEDEPQQPPRLGSPPEATYLGWTGTFPGPGLGRPAAASDAAVAGAAIGEAPHVPELGALGSVFAVLPLLQGNGSCGADAGTEARSAVQTDTSGFAVTDQFFSRPAPALRGGGAAESEVETQAEADTYGSRDSARCRNGSSRRSVVSPSTTEQVLLAIEALPKDDSPCAGAGSATSERDSNFASPRSSSLRGSRQGSFSAIRPTEELAASAFRLAASMARNGSAWSSVASRNGTQTGEEANGCPTEPAGDLAPRQVVISGCCALEAADPEACPGPTQQPPSGSSDRERVTGVTPGHPPGPLPSLALGLAPGGSDPEHAVCGGSSAGTAVRNSGTMFAGFGPDPSAGFGPDPSETWIMDTLVAKQCQRHGLQLPGLGNPLLGEKLAAVGCQSPVRAPPTGSLAESATSMLLAPAPAPAQEMMVANASQGTAEAAAAEATGADPKQAPQPTGCIGPAVHASGEAGIRKTNAVDVVAPAPAMHASNTRSSAAPTRASFTESTGTVGPHAPSGQQQQPLQLAGAPQGDVWHLLPTPFTEPRPSSGSSSGSDIGPSELPHPASTQPAWCSPVLRPASATAPGGPGFGMAQLRSAAASPAVEIAYPRKPASCGTFGRALALALGSSDRAQSQRRRRHHTPSGGGGVAADGCFGGLLDLDLAPGLGVGHASVAFSSSTAQRTAPEMESTNLFMTADVETYLVPSQTQVSYAPKDVGTDSSMLINMHQAWAAGVSMCGTADSDVDECRTVAEMDPSNCLQAAATCPMPRESVRSNVAAAVAERGFAPRSHGEDGGSVRIGGRMGAGGGSSGGRGWPPLRRRNTRDRLMLLASSLSRDASDEEAADEHEWHDVYACVRRDESSGRAVVVVTQTEVTEQVEVQRKLEALLEHEHKVLESIFPRHVIEHMMLLSKQRSAAAGAAGGLALGSSWAQLRGSALDALATSHRCVTVLFCDIIGFTAMCKEVTAMEVMRFLNTLYMKFDELIDIYGVYKVETIGDCYMVAGGLVRTDGEGNKSVIGEGSEDALHAVRVMSFAKAIMREAAAVVLPTNGEPVQLRIGLHSGPVMSGIVGDKMPRFCLFGDTVNTASRMESTCPPGGIHVSADTRELLRNEAWVASGGVQVKGKGLLETYMWAGHPAEEDEDAERRLKVYI